MSSLSRLAFDEGRAHVSMLACHHPPPIFDAVRQCLCMRSNALHAAKGCSIILAALVQATVGDSDFLKHRVCACMQLISALLIGVMKGVP